MALRRLKHRAELAGLTRWIEAKGMWVLSTDGTIQVETIWIGVAPKPSARVRRRLPALAAFVKEAADQDAVAWEELGKLRFI